MKSIAETLREAEPVTITRALKEAGLSEPLPRSDFHPYGGPDPAPAPTTPRPPHVAAAPTPEPAKADTLPSEKYEGLSDAEAAELDYLATPAQPDPDAWIDPFGGPERRAKAWW